MDIYVCIIVYTVSGFTENTVAILSEFQQYCQKFSCLYIQPVLAILPQQAIKDILTIWVVV